ncbi:MAG: GSCFA domain-containing protein [Chitinophagales bacterium]
MEFRTKINIPVSPFKVTHQDRLLLMGSCFTENIGHYLNRYQFATNINPFGIIYQPVSIFNNLKKVIKKEIYSAGDLLQNNGLYLSLDHHGQFSGTDQGKVLSTINASIDKAHADFNAARFIIITLGTAFVYKHLEQDRIVANCHKIPNTAFEKRLLSMDEIKVAFNDVKDLLKDKTVIFTVSPVRHWRDGAVENQRSKSILIASIHQLIDEHNNCFYFPAYEIMMDELRDYRFYAEDMLHPNEVAVKYIWQRFAEAYFSEDTQHINVQLEKINSLLQHRIINTNTEAQTHFEQKVQNTITAFKLKYPELAVNFR